MQHTAHRLAGREAAWWSLMPDPAHIRINDELAIPLSELRFRFSRSSGPGGQRVNRTSTRVELLFDVKISPSLSARQREMILGRLAGYVDGAGVLHLVSRATRSQFLNRRDVIARFRRLLARSLRVPARRVATRPTRAARESRLKKKRMRSLLKRIRRRVTGED